MKTDIRKVLFIGQASIAITQDQEIELPREKQGIIQLLNYFQEDENELI